MSSFLGLRTVRAASFVLLAACSGGIPGRVPSPDGGGSTQVPGTPVAVALSVEQQAEVDRLQKLLAETKDLTAEQLLSKRAVPWKATLGYDPAKAVNLPLIQGSDLKLDAAELAALTAKGFVVSDKRRYPHFAYGYKTIYSQDLPVYITADAILEAVHQSYDSILQAIEREALIPEMTALLTSMRDKLAGAAGLEEATRKDSDLFLAVALSLLQGSAAAPKAGASAADVNQLVALAEAASGTKALTLFGADREIDLSQFKPRGHYNNDPRLQKYFRALIWLGRIDFPFMQTNPGTGKPELVRRSVAAALALRGLMDDQAVARWQRIDHTVQAFVGEPDSMGPLEVDRLKADLGITGDSLGALSDEQIARAIVAGAYGKQRILSQIVRQAPHEGTWPIDATFLFFGQRYVFDSHVFSNVVYDRVNIPGASTRMMPNPLDVAYAALGNDQGVALLADDLGKHRYAPALESMRRLGDEHGSAFWSANLYNIWLSALRSLSPGPELASSSGLPAVAATESWGRRLLSTQLASWAELRHDTILYVKQSYTSGAACEFPDAYVEPYPAFFGQLEKMAKAGGNLASTLPLPAGSALGLRLPAYFKRLGEVAAILREMAELQRAGMPHKPEHLAFINQAVELQPIGCAGPPGIRGWYADLFFSQNAVAAFDPTIADVHTQPTDEGGGTVGRVLHVGTGYPRLMVVTVDTCMGPRAYAGVVSTYHEVVTNDFERLTDQEWVKRFSDAAIPPDVPWMQDLVVK